MFDSDKIDENTIRDMLCTLEKDGKIPHISFDTPIDEIMKMDFCSAVLGLLNMVIE